MTEIYFDELYSVVVNNLKRAKEEVKVAVAWINFDLYNRIFQELLSKGVRLSIIINDDFINFKHNDKIQNLINNGANVKKIKMPRYNNRMHNKICIIDNQIVLTGSYNWSKNAANNFENLVVIEEKVCANKVNREFEYIWNTPKEELSKLQEVEYCKQCNDFLLNLIVIKFNVDKYEHAEYKLVRYCGCDKYSIIKSDYLDVRFETTLNGIIDQFEDDKLDFPDEIDQLKMLYDNSIQVLLTSVFEDEKIDAIGIISGEVLPFNYETIYQTNIYWKKRFKSNLIEDSYEEIFDLL
ncbi:phospholipase D-like domain-containing protein [Lysinibacillus sp. fls2-241-R2A-57]|uniref:phospholipase D-like domain-containing protein n=1 Tax=Lysinibacillus sp. fls2-241-R2A-57 TaxID=3040292 RepID=UPI00255638D9|nr:phospholipase D-like domain-containing protein [Lysinibacillus sp. fls2-241-R2A-57]